MATQTEVVDYAVEVLRRGEPLTLDAVARESGLTKPGVVHHVVSKENLVTLVVDRITDRWEADLVASAPTAITPQAKLAAYVDYALTGEFDNSDLAFVIDTRLRDGLAEQWVARLSPWFGDDIPGTATHRAALRAARLIGDGAWLNKALGIDVTPENEVSALRDIAHRLIHEGVAR